MDFLAVFFIFTGLIVIHELGHFLVARYFNITIYEFGVGFPPRLFGVVRDLQGKMRFFWGDKAPAESEIGTNTIYSFNMLPLGGFVRPKGEDDSSLVDGMSAAKPGARIAVLVAGPLMNLLAGALILSYIFFSEGLPVPGRVQFTGVEPGSPAMQAGFLAGDVVLSVNGESVSEVPGLQSYVLANVDRELTFEVERNGQTVTILATPLKERAEAGRGALGVLLSLERVDAGDPLQSLAFGFSQTANYSLQLVRVPVLILTGQEAPESFRFVGLKGIFDLFSQAFSTDREAAEKAAQVAPVGESAAPPAMTPLSVLSMVAGLSISLGTINLFPIPALDGGRILFVLPELLFGRRIPDKYAVPAHAFGFLLLISLMLYVNVMDFVDPMVIK
jgi:regulator of sigma E protease